MRRPIRLAAVFVSAVLVPLVTVPVPAEAQRQVSSRPARQTTFILDSPVGLAGVGDGLRAARARPIDFLHTGPSQGGHHSGALPLDGVLAAYQEDYNVFHPGEPQVQSFTVAGAVPTSRLGRLADAVAERQVVEASSEGEDLRTTESEVTAAAAPKLFAPRFGRTITSDTNSDRVTIKQEMTWDSQESIDAFGENAYEHDMKLFNRGNIASIRPACFPGQSNNFWATRGGLTFITNYTPEQKPYLDTDVSDSCETQDLTIGLYHPNQLVPGRQYETSIVTDAGDTATSPYALVAQTLPKACDFNPFCVGTIPRGGDSQLLIGEQRGVAPECRTWEKGQPSSPC